MLKLKFIPDNCYRNEFPLPIWKFDALAVWYWDAGIEERQAEAQATALATVLKSGVAELATGRDIEALRASIKQDTDRLESRMSLLEERTEGRFKLLQWILAFKLAMSVALLWILIRTATA